MALADVKRDSEGFLLNLSDWTPEVASLLAEEESIVLSDDHWTLLQQARSFQKTYDSSPSMRAFIKFLKLNNHADLASSIALLQRFPGSPAKLISKIAGLAKPENCL